MKVRIAFGNEDFTVTLKDHASAREFVNMLPLDLTISDHGSNEKIAHMPRQLTELTRRPLPNPMPGDVCYYVPWGNLAFYHGNYESTRDLGRLGRLDGSEASSHYGLNSRRRCPLLAKSSHSRRSASRQKRTSSTVTVPLLLAGTCVLRLVSLSASLPLRSFKRRSQALV